MIETDEQRRWWFATHPEYSWSRKGKKNRGHSEQRKTAENNEKVRPEEVDAYVDNALQYVNGPVAELLKSVKRNFGTEAEPPPASPQASGHRAVGRDTPDKHKHARPRRKTYTSEELERMRQADKQGLIADSHTFLDVAPYGRFLIAPIKSLKGLLRGLARQSILSAAKKKGTRWKRGQHHLTPTSKGKGPTWDTQRQRYWKNQAEKEGAVEKWGAENVERMKKGLAPLRKNRDTGEWEAMECHHRPKPQREGGTEFKVVTREEHARIDPKRRLGKRKPKDRKKK